MKRLLCVFVFVFAFMGCSSKDTCSSVHQFMKDNGKTKVLSTIAMIDSLVEEIGGKHIDHICLITGEIDPHSYELVKGDGEKFERADILFANGLGLEHGASVGQQIKSHRNAVVLGDHLYRQCREELLLIDGQIDPHVWMDIALWSRNIDPIVAALSKHDPKHAEEFAANGERFKHTMMQSHSRIYTAMQSIPEKKRFLVTSHDAFNYFARRYLAKSDELLTHSWKKRVAAPQGLAPDSQLSLMDLQEIIEHLARHDIPVVFPESNISLDALNKVIDAGLKKGMRISMVQKPLYGDAMKGTYLEMMRHNAEVIAQSLKHE